jgi:eukaryotic-like serine/threonine-protein kinase
VSTEGQRIGRYVLHDAIASGGMASVHFGRMVGPGGFARTVVIKRLHAHLVQDVEFAAMFLDEGRLAARIRHPNVVSTVDVASLDGELLLVMEYVRGESLSRLVALLGSRHETIPLPILSSIALGVLYGLDAAHEARTETGEPLGIVHRDVSPQNVMVGADGLARVADFGVAKAASRAHSTQDGKIKGKLSYMAPEQIQRLAVDPRADVYAVGVILWETLAGRRLFVADDAMAVMHAVLHDPIPPLLAVAPDTPSALAEIVDKALCRRPEDRFATALEMAEAIETASPPALQRQVGVWLLATASDAIAERDRILAAVETSTPSDVDAPPPLPDALVRLTEQATAATPAVPEGASMVTGLSVSGEVVVGRRIRGRGPILAVAVFGAAVAALGLLLMRDVAPAREVAASSSPSASASDEKVGAAPSVAVASSAPSPLATAAAPRPVPPTHPLPRAPRGKSGRPAGACEPPFVVGADGIERFKPGCL